MAERMRAPSAAALALPLLAALAALALRVALLGQHAFHIDEALYATFSRRILHGDLLLTGGLNNDKPPLQFYLGALGLALGGNGESAIRFMDALVSAAECGVLVWALQPVSGRAAALGAGLLLAACPLHRAYGASGLTDAPLALALTLSLALALRGRSVLAGLAWGLACACKQSAAFVAPLALAAALASDGAWAEALAGWLAGAAMALLPLLAWSALFAHPRLGMILLQSSGQPEVGLRLAGLGPRFGAWMAETGGLTPFAGWAAGALWASAGAGLALGWAWRRRAQRGWAVYLLLPLWSLGVYTLLNLRHYDRYFLPLAAPLAAMPALLAASLPQAARRVAGLAVLLLGLAGIAQARLYAFPPSQLGAAGATGDGLKALLLEAQAALPQGAAVAGSTGGVRWMGAWYLPGSFDCSDDDSPEAMRRQCQSRPGRPLVWVGRGGQTPPAGWRWRALAQASDGAGGPPWCAWVADSPAPPAEGPQGGAHG